MVFRTFLTAVVAWLATSMTLVGQGTADPLEVAITLGGAVKVDRGEKDTSFFISSGVSQVMVMVMNEHAFPPAPNDTMSYQWAERLAAVPRISVEIGDVRENMKTSTVLNEVMMCFTDPAPERKGGDVSFLLQCVAWDTSKALKREGKQVIEMALVIAARSGDAADVYLGKPRPENSLVYARLQD